MVEYLWLVKQTMDHFLNDKVVRIAKGNNWHADSLATLVTSSTKKIP